MEDIVINGYTQVLLAAIGTTLVGAVGTLWIMLWKVNSEKNAMYEKNQDRYEALVDRYHNFATTLERTIERAVKG